MVKETFEEFKQQSIDRLEHLRNNMNKVIIELKNCKNDMEIAQVMLRNAKYF